MKRISESVKNRLLEIPILRVAEALDIQVRRKVAHCFLHDDQHPSLGFNTTKNTWHCYACDIGGNQIYLVMQKLGLSYVEACKWLADHFGIVLPDDDGKRAKYVVRQPRPKKKPEAEPVMDIELMSWIVARAGLSAKAKEFLFEERKYRRDIVQQLQIGSISNADRLVEMLVAEFGEERALASRIVRKNSRRRYLFFYTPCLLIPYRDIEGRVMTLQARYLGSKPGVPRFQFIEGAYTGMFNAPLLQQLPPEAPLYISEGVTDCLALLSSGKQAIALPSATLFHDRDIAPLVSRQLYMYPDKDRAGERLYEKLTEKLGAYGTTIHRLGLPEECKDYSDYYVKNLQEK